MSRSAAAARAADHERAVRMPRGRPRAAPRRVSGPLRPRVEAPALALSDAALSPAPRPRLPSRPPLRLASGSAAIALRVAEAAMEVSGSRTMDRLVRSRAWVVIVGFGLIGIVAMQVSLLKLNAGIGRAVETAATLERSNATLRGDVSRLSSGDRIQALAGARGYVMPEPGDVTYLRAGGPSSDGVRAARRMQAPDPSIAGPAGSTILASTLTGPGAAAGPAAQPTAAAAGVAPAAATTTAPDGAGAPAATSPTPTPTPTPAATAPATVTAPAPVAPATTTAPVTTAAPVAPATAAAVPASSSTGGTVP